jgi:hypothetical protein
MVTDDHNHNHNHIRNFHKRKAAIADENKRKRLLAENNQTYIKYVLEAKGKKRETVRRAG